MSNLIELLSDLALLESTPSDMNQPAMSLIFDMKTQLDNFCADLTSSPNLAATSHHNDEYSTHYTHHDEFRSFSQSTESNFESIHCPFQANPGLGVAALSKSSESRSGAMDANGLQVNSHGDETHSESRFRIGKGDYMVINALNPGFPTPRSTDAALERPAATGQYYLNASQSSTSSPTTQNKRVFPGSLSRTSGADLVSDSAMFTSLAGPSNKDSTIRPNATQMKSALVEAPSRTAAGRAQKNGKGGMDPENHEIYRLRQQNKHFDEIAEIMNNARTGGDKPSTLTGNAIYGRYMRNASFIAAAKGEVFKPCELDLQAGTNLKAITQPVPAGFDENEDRMLVEAYKYVRENMWMLVSKRLEEMTGRVHSPADCANRFNYL